MYVVLFSRISSNDMIFEREVVLPPKRTVVCLFAKGDDVDRAEFVAAKGNNEVSSPYATTKSRDFIIHCVVGLVSRNGQTRCF